MNSISKRKSYNISSTSEIVVKAYSHCTGTGPGQVWGTGLGAMGPNILFRNVQIGLMARSHCTEPGPRLGQEQGERGLGSEK